MGLFNTAMHSLDPVLILEHHALEADVPVAGHGAGGTASALDLDYCIPFGSARIVRPGTDMTVATYSSTVSRVVAVADALDTTPGAPTGGRDTGGSAATGAIVNVSSVGGLLPLSRALSYPDSKAAVASFTRWLAIEMANRHDGRIRVNAVAPGFALTG